MPLLSEFPTQALPPTVRRRIADDPIFGVPPIHGMRVCKQSARTYEISFAEEE